MRAALGYASGGEGDDSPSKFDLSVLPPQAAPGETLVLAFSKLFESTPTVRA